MATHQVVWWDPSKLTLNVEGGLGIRQQELLAEDGGASLAAYREWQRGTRASCSNTGPHRSWMFFCASQAADRAGGCDSGELSTCRESRRAAGRAAVRNAGSRVLRDVALDATGDAIAKLVRVERARDRRDGSGIGSGADPP